MTGQNSFKIADKYYTKCGVEQHEYNMHKHVYNMKIVNIPKVISYDKNKKIMVMEKISGDSVSDFYGEDPNEVPEHIFDHVRDIIKTLALNGIEYPDITGYNFIMDQDERLWIIDFEHARLKKNIKNRYINNFCAGKNAWNPLFK
jgi:tRNA A-37 threonylcarbamoyl transferase component Bud32